MRVPYTARALRALVPLAPWDNLVYELGVATVCGVLFTSTSCLLYSFRFRGVGAKRRIFTSCFSSPLCSLLSRFGLRFSRRLRKGMVSIVPSSLFVESTR